MRSLPEGQGVSTGVRTLLASLIHGQLPHVPDPSLLLSHYRRLPQVIWFIGNSVGRYRFFALQALMIGGFRPLGQMKNKTEQWEICGRGGKHFGKRQVRISNATHDWRDNGKCKGVCACSMLIPHLQLQLGFMWYMSLTDDLASRALLGVPLPVNSHPTCPPLVSHPRQSSRGGILFSFLFPSHQGLPDRPPKTVQSPLVSGIRSPWTTPVTNALPLSPSTFPCHHAMGCPPAREEARNTAQGQPRGASDVQ